MASISSEHTLQTEHGGHNVETLSFNHVISKYKLDFKQSVAFEIISYSFILKSLRVHTMIKVKKINYLCSYLVWVVPEKVML